MLWHTLKAFPRSADSLDLGGAFFTAACASDSQLQYVGWLVSAETDDNAPLLVLFLRRTWWTVSELASILLVSPSGLLQSGEQRVG